MSKQLLVAVGITFGIVAILIGLVSIFGSDNSSQTSFQSLSNQSGSVDSHHGGSPQIDEARFQSLLGKKAANFELESYDGEKISLEKLRGKNVVLFFTEGLMCYPSCWNQMAAFGKDSTFNNKDTVTLSITVDRRQDWSQAIAKMPELSAATVLFDETRVVSSEYGVLTLSSSMHRGQFPGHTYLIVDKDGIIRFILDDPQMAVRNDELKTELMKIK